jgi:hypothetical protein
VFIFIIGCDPIPLPFHASKTRIESASGAIAKAFNTPHGPRALGTVGFADWLRAHESPVGQRG